MILCLFGILKSLIKVFQCYVIFFPHNLVPSWLCSKKLLDYDRSMLMEIYLGILENSKCIHRGAISMCIQKVVLERN